nr:hypothetical protein [Tanacetum cinerariifolium]
DGKRRWLGSDGVVLRWQLKVADQSRIRVGIREGHDIHRVLVDKWPKLGLEALVPRHMRFFLDQKNSETRRFMSMHKEAETVRGCINQMTALVTELQAMKNQDEVYNGLLATKDAKHGEESKLVALNDLIAEALDDIDTLEIDVEILGGDDNGVYGFSLCSLLSF